MADAAMNILFEHLSNLLVQEASLLSGVRDEVEDIKLELDSMRAFLRDADRRKDSNEGVRSWVGQVRDIAFDIEDIIDEFMYRMDKSGRSGFIGCLHYPIRLPVNIFHKHRFATLLQEAKGKVHNISERRIRYGINQMEEGTNTFGVSEKWQRDAESSLSTWDDDIVGMKKELGLLAEWLVEEEPRRTVISVTGMGGLGKTTLVTKAYNNNKLKKHFDCQACVSVSQTLRVDDLLRNLMKQFLEAKKEVVPNDIATMNIGELRRTVNRYLQQKKYIVILDDVWSMNDWYKISGVFPDCKNGSRLMVTTRDAGIAFALGEGSRVCKLQSLGEEEAWELFCRKAFWNEACPSELEPLARAIVNKCEGLPLAIVALGSLLSLRDKTSFDWNKVYDNLSWQLRNNQMLEPIKHILLLSFYDLPYRLKHCFLYCCMYPEDYLIRRKRLIRLWVAEGFVEETGRITMEEAADDYLKDLIHRNMLLVAEINEFGRVKAFRVHDLMREVALSLSDEEKFCMTYDGLQSRQDDRVRRMSIYHSEEINQLSTSLACLRSLLVFDRATSFTSSLNTMASKFKLLRVLNLEAVPIEGIPDELTDLFNLRYLNLRKTKVKELPESLGRLQNLQTLDVRDTMMERLPSGIVKLRKLRHLYCYRYNDGYAKNFDYFGGIQVPKGICKITSLQSLADIEGKEGEIVRQVGNLIQLRRLGIFKLRAADGDELCHSIGKMKHLLTLGLKTKSEEEPLRLEALSPHPPPHLQKLFLNGYLEKVPKWFSSLSNLTHLWLGWSRLIEEDPLSSIKALPNLVHLQLVKAYEGQQLCFHEGSFPKLKTLYLVDMAQLNQVTIEKGAMPIIQNLYLVRCAELKMLPQGIEYLIRLQELYLDQMPAELLESLKLKDEGEGNHKKVGHIPSISHGAWTASLGWVMERLN